MAAGALAALAAACFAGQAAGGVSTFPPPPGPAPASVTFSGSYDLAAVRTGHGAPDDWTFHLEWSYGWSGTWDDLLGGDPNRSSLVDLAFTSVSIGGSVTGRFVENGQVVSCTARIVANPLRPPTLGGNSYYDNGDGKVHLTLAYSGSSGPPEATFAYADQTHPGCVLHAPVSGAPADLSVLPLVGLVADAVTGGSAPRTQSWAWTENVPGLITPTSIAWSASIEETLAFGGCGAAPARRLAGVRGPTCGTYVALGDSYSSGAGLSRVDPDEGDGGSCRRSSLAYPRLVAKALEREVVHVACSGAKTAHVLGVGWQGEPPQIERIDERTTLVTVTVGGNDVGFARVLEACIAPAAVRRKPCPAARKRFERALGGVASSLLETYGAIVERASPIATIAVVAYPRFVPPPARKPGKASRSRKCTVVRSPIPLVGIVTWSEQEVRWFFDMINALNSQIRASVIAAGGVHPTSRIVLADPNPMFLGHDICQRKRGNDDDGDAVGESWFGQVQLIRGLKEAYFHPTLEGHRAIAQAVVAAVDAS